MNKPYWILSACLALAASTVTVRADQFGLLNSVGNPGPAGMAQPAVPYAPLPEPGTSATPRLDWLGRQVSYDAVTGPETQVGKSMDCACDDCCLPPWAHRHGVFFELMVLRARDAE